MRIRVSAKDMSGKRVCGGWRKFLLFLPVVILFLYTLPVLELHPQTNSQVLRKEKPKKYDHIVIGPAAGEGRPDRLHCNGLEALNRTQFQSSSDNSAYGDQVAFVTVFTAYNVTSDRQVSGRPADLVTVGNISFSKVERSMAILNVFINFIQATMPRSNIFILTDPASELPLRRDRVTVQPIQGEYSRDKLMLQRIRSYIAFLEAKLEQEQTMRKTIHYIFTDSDMAIVDDLGQIFTEYPNFDVALTFRNNKEQPLNSGFIAVKATVEGIRRAKAFLQEVLRVYSSRFMKASRMLGDQMALAWVVKSHPSFDARRFTRKEAFLDTTWGTSVLFLPCSRYNWTPPEGAGQFHGMPLDVKVVHFKGSRKRLMLESWNFLNSSSNIANMLCLVLKSGRTKYDF